MKVFVGFGYNADDKWITELIIPFIETLGCEVVTGEEMQGEKLSDGVIERIKSSDACIGFLTKRGNPTPEGTYSTHWWVLQELSIANTLGKPNFELREKGVEPQKGIGGDRQRYEFTDKTQLLVEVTKFVMKEKSKLTYKVFMLLPPEFSSEIRPHYRYAKCKYRFQYRGKYYDPEEVPIERMQGGYGIIITRIPSEEAQIDISVEGPSGISWNSGFVSVGLMNVHLQKDN